MDTEDVVTQVDNVASEQVNAASEDVLKAIESFKESFRDRSFSGRNKDLGKMIKCRVCSRRHRSSQVCEYRFARVRINHSREEYRQTEAMNPKPRLGIGPKNRMLPHFSKRRLLLVQRVKEFIAAMPGSEDFANEVRDLMFKNMKRDWKLRAKTYRDTQKQSRAINRAIS